MKTLVCRCGGAARVRVSDHVAPSWDGKNLYSLECEKCHNHTSWFENQKRLHEVWKEFYGKEIDI